MEKKRILGLILLGILMISVVGCGTSNETKENGTLENPSQENEIEENKTEEKVDLKIEDYFGEYEFDEVAYMRKTSTISQEQYENDVKAVEKTFKDGKFTIEESYFNETTGTFLEKPAENFEWLTIKEYGEKYYDEKMKENLENFKGLDYAFDYELLQDELQVKEIMHYTMYEEGGVLSNPMIYISENHIYVAMETIAIEEMDGTLNGITHYLLKLK